MLPKSYITLAGRGWHVGGWAGIDTRQGAVGTLRKRLDHALLGAAVLVAVTLSACGPAQPEPPAPPPPPPVITRIAVTPDQLSLAAREQYRPTVTAIFSDGSQRDVSGAAAGTVYLLDEHAPAQVRDDGMLAIAEDAVTLEQFSLAVSHGGFDVELPVTIRNILAKTVSGAGPDEPPGITNYQSIDAVVNKERNLPPAYVPPDLVVVDVPHAGEPKQMREAAARSLEQLFAAAQADGWLLYAASGYRSYEAQAAIFERNVAHYGLEQASRFSARPGQSEHQTGLAMDVTSAAVGYRLVQEFGQTGEGRWLAQSAARFGFVIRYPEDREQVTGYAYEPWHLRYVGVSLAAALVELELTLEEYLGD